MLRGPQLQVGRRSETHAQPSLNLDLARHTQPLGAFLQLKLAVVWSRPAAFDTPLQRNCHAAWKVSRDRKITARFPGPQATFGGYGAVREQGFVPEHASRRAAPSNGRRLYALKLSLNRFSACSSGSIRSCSRFLHVCYEPRSFSRLLGVELDFNELLGLVGVGFEPPMPHGRHSALY